ncbi:hypothetical protein TNCV_2419111 [Trichonephila clavipes]|nr:hypothetical protein TNCV_2419111 [Trichonephila clavipes]
MYAYIHRCVRSDKDSSSHFAIRSGKHASTIALDLPRFMLLESNSLPNPINVRLAKDLVFKEKINSLQAVQRYVYKA